MEVETTTPVDSSTTQETLNKMTDATRAEWLRTGKLPEHAEKQESAPASPEKAEAKEPAAGDESESAPDKDEDEVKLSEKGQRRFKQLLGRIKELEAEVAKSKTAPDKVVEREQKPRITNYDTVDDYEKAMDAWTAKEVEFKAQEALTKERAEKEKADRDSAVEARNKELEKNWRGQVTASTKLHPDFLEVAAKAPLIEGSIPDGYLVHTCECGTELLYYFGQHPEELERINEMENKLAQVRELTKIELKLSSPPATIKEKPKVAVITPKPASEVGSRGTPAEDPVTEALKEGDFAKYQREANARERKARGN